MYNISKCFKAIEAFQSDKFLVGVSIDTYVFYQSVLQKKT